MPTGPAAPNLAGSGALAPIVVRPGVLPFRLHRRREAVVGHGGLPFGAGLDVWEEIEPPPASHPLMTLPNVIGTPHSAGGTLETQEKSSLKVAEQLWHVLNGGEPDSRIV